MKTTKALLNLKTGSSKRNKDNDRPVRLHVDILREAMKITFCRREPRYWQRYLFFKMTDPILKTKTEIGMPLKPIKVKKFNPKMGVNSFFINFISVPL